LTSEAVASLAAEVGDEDDIIAAYEHYDMQAVSIMEHHPTGLVREKIDKL